MVSFFIRCVVIAAVVCPAIPALGQSSAARAPYLLRDAAPQEDLGRERSKRFTREEDVLRFISDYREDKQPNVLPEAVRAMVRLGLLRDPEKAGVHTGFIAGVLSENQLQAATFIAEMFPMPPAEQVVLIKAVAFSGLPDWKGLLGQFVERMPARKVLISKYLYGDGQTLGELGMDDPFVIDVHWGFYFATGAWEPGIRIISALKWAEEQNDIEKLTLGSMAKWTLASNAARDKNLLDLAKVQLNHENETVRRQLREVIQAAELYELGKLREDALKRIDALRAGGPQNAKDWAKWGNYGTTALALGCVAAAALGQVQLGIPCVVGGALSTAAVKYLGPGGGPGDFR